MRIYYIGKEEDFDIAMNKVEDNSVVIAGYGVTGAVDLVKELGGTSNILKTISCISRMKNLVFICGNDAYIYDRKYKSVTLIDCGRIMGISDATHYKGLDREYSLGASYRIYETSLGKIGIIVGGDMAYPEVARALTERGAEYIVNIADFPSCPEYELSLKANAYFNGIMIFAFSEDKRYMIARDGRVTLKSADSYIEGEYIISRDRRLINSRRAEIYNDIYIEQRRD